MCHSLQVAHDAGGARRHYLVSLKVHFADASRTDASTSFATVGMFSAVSNLGAGGTQDVSLSDTANGVLYGMFALTGLISGGINNCRSFLSCIQVRDKNSSVLLVIGPRLTLFIGTLGYALYVGALWW